MAAAKVHDDYKYQGAIVFIAKRNSGFTMTELMVTVAVISVLAAVAVPQMREFIVNSNVSATTNDLVLALNTARSEASKRGQDVEVVANGTWSEGWSVQTTVAPIEVILSQNPLDEGYTIAGLKSGGVDSNRIIYRPEGSLRDGTAYNFNICRPANFADPAKSRRITIQQSGTLSSRRNIAGSPAGACP